MRSTSRPPARRPRVHGVAQKAGYHHGDLRSALVKAARTLVESDGLAQLTLRSAAAMAGVSAAAPYRHFADKDSLLAAVLGEGFDELAASTEQARKRARSARGGLAAVGRAYLDFAARRPKLYALMFGPACDKALHPGLLQSGQASLAVLLQAVEDCQREGLLGRRDPRVVALAGWAMCHGLASLQADRMLEHSLTMDPTRAAEALIDTLLDGALSAAPAPA